MNGIDKLNLPVADSSRELLKLFRTMVKSLRLCDPMFVSPASCSAATRQPPPATTGGRESG